jgi:hypothetical protein
VLLWEHLAVFDGLDSAVIVVLVDFLINRGYDILVFMLFDGLMLDCWCNSLVYGSVVMTGLVHEVGDGCFGFVHCDVK